MATRPSDGVPDEPPSGGNALPPDDGNDQPVEGVLPQERLIARVREVCAADSRLAAALTYGSFAAGAGDAHSDVEFWLFFAVPVPDARAWLGDLGPILHVVRNEFGAHVVFFPGLVRGEFHLATAAEIGSVATWPARGAPVDRMIVLDRTGALRRALESLPAEPAPPATPDEIAELCGRFANWLVLAHHVSRRGELLRAIDALAHAHRHLLWMTRLAERRTQHWLTPSRAAETDLPPTAVAALHALAPTADPAAITGAIAATWRFGRHRWRQLTEGTAPDALILELDGMLTP
ncbi:lincosamide nucleotidyltransferase [Catenuloplanes nepalensis]|uniref:Lincosamide nucleotidyltransferase n=1 Tax=Catenuloplanes nepalensis TaxID=587533 RepID=A0ABT9MLM1_9ACTN|nr:hypothetical protein [Catenuloplanes nepalensis]MDP9792322.1 lincosamide nucleotidyltransferase [Catenuloplanes nepalensis]